jgi:hypothetical protein
MYDCLKHPQKAGQIGRIANLDGLSAQRVKATDGLNQRLLWMRIKCST